MIKQEQSNNSLKAILLDSLTKIDETNYFVPSYEKALEELPDDENSQIILAFSKPIKNYLIVEALEDYNSSKELSRMQMFNQSLVFLIYFDERNTIVEVLTEEIQYD